MPTLKKMYRCIYRYRHTAAATAVSHLGVSCIIEYIYSKFIREQETINYAVSVS